MRVQGTIRDKNANGDRLITLVPRQRSAGTRRKQGFGLGLSAGIDRSGGERHRTKAIFRRRVALSSKEDDEERKALEMIYRKEVEFAVGHGVSVHAEDRCR